MMIQSRSPGFGIWQGSDDLGELKYNNHPQVRELLDLGDIRGETVAYVRWSSQVNPVKKAAREAAHAKAMREATIVDFYSLHVRSRQQLLALMGLEDYLVLSGLAYTVDVMDEME